MTVGDVLAYTDASVANGTTYRYAISAISAAGEGPKTGEVTAARGTAPTAVRSLTATSTKSGIALTWVAPASDGGSAVTGFKVYRGTKAGAETLYVSYGSNAIGMTDTAVVEADHVLLQGDRGERARRERPLGRGERDVTLTGAG